REGLAVPQPQIPDRRRRAADAVLARSRHRRSDPLEGRAVRGGGPGAQAPDAAPRRQPEVTADRESTTEGDRRRAPEEPRLGRIGLAIIRPTAALAIAGG